MNDGIKLWYLRLRLISALVLIAVATLSAYFVNRAQLARIEAREEVGEAMDTALATMAEQLVYLGGIRSAVGPLHAIDDRGALHRSIPKLDAAISTLEGAFDRGVMAPRSQTVFANAMVDPLTLLHLVVETNRTVARDLDGWGPAAAFNIAMASSANMQALPLVRQIKEFESADLVKQAARMELWRRGSVGVVLVLLALVWLKICLPLEKRIVGDHAALQAERRMAESASAAKSTFIATMSHEIRTPLVGVLGAAELLRDAPDDPAREELADTILSSGRALLSILNDTLDYSKIEAGQIEISEAPSDVRDIIRNLNRLFAHQAKGKGLVMAVELPDNLASGHMVDTLRLRQVLANVIGNAVKFTEAGSVTLRVSAADVRDRRQALTFDVLDTGMGMTPDELSHIFEAYRQADGTTARRHGGTGLGLAIARRLAEAMGGRLVAESEPGKGSAFRLTIEAAVVGEAAVVEIAKKRSAPHVVSASGAAGGVQPLRTISPDGSAGRTGATDLRASAQGGPRPLLLVVDDNRTNRMVATRLLSGSGWRIDVACDGAEAIAAAERLRPDLVMMDISMPGMDGYAATRLIRENERRLGRAPARIIAMSAHTGEEHRTQCLEAGMDDVLAKPFSRSEVEARLAETRTRLEADAAPPRPARRAAT